MKYRGYEIDKELDGSFSVYHYGYMANRKTIEECQKYIDAKLAR